MSRLSLRVPRPLASRISLAACAAAFLFAPPTLAQDAVTIRIVDGGRAAPGVEVQVLFLGEAWRVGETDGDGRVRAPVDLVGLERGDRIEVHLFDCGQARTVALVPPDEDPAAECERRGGAAMGCRCAALGAFRWGDDTTIELTPRPPGDAAAPPREDRREPRRPREPGVLPLWVLGAGGGLASFTGLDVACEPEPAPAVTGCDLTAERPTFRASIEFRPWPDVPFAFAGDVGWTPNLQVEQTFAASADPRDPESNHVVMDVLEMGGYGLGRWSSGGALEVWAALGYVWVFNSADVETRFGPLGSRTALESREDSGGRIGARAGMDWWLEARPWGVRLQAGGMSGEGDDADTAWHVAAMLVFGGGR
ncbi:MAG TPA: hypothetical protein VM778_03840 [Gemmatimonadota bacterium]|nr:hypothetical protein [Gemmatimonadota bacterium]